MTIPFPSFTPEPWVLSKALLLLALPIPSQQALADAAPAQGAPEASAKGAPSSGGEKKAAAAKKPPKSKRNQEKIPWTKERSDLKKGVSDTDISVHLCPDRQRPPPEGFTDLMAAIPGLKSDIRYHGTGNFTGGHVPGYGAPGAWLMDAPAQALKRVQEALAEKGLGLIVYDAYRPRRGTDGMVDWAYRTGQVALLDGGYVARRSRHNHGVTVDLGLVDLKTGQVVDMGTDFDTLSEESHTKNAKGRALENRLTLKAAMEKEGFKAYFREWWHFEMKVPGSRPRDVPYGACETDEAKGFADGTER